MQDCSRHSPCQAIGDCSLGHLFTVVRCVQANVEMMLEYMPLEAFKAVYVVDLCASLCEQARCRMPASIAQA